ANQLDGQVNLRDAVDGTITFRSPEGKTYQVGNNPAVLVVRPRGWHLHDRFFSVDGTPLSGALVDFGLFVFHNARTLHQRDRGPYFYLPKLEAMEEAALWEDVMSAAEAELQLPRGTMKATVLIETLPAAFQMDEILHALRRRIVGLNCGRWDYIFSYLKTLRGHRDGRHGGADPDQGRRGGERSGAGQGARRQTARGQSRPRRHLGRPPRAGAGGAGDLRRIHARAEPARQTARGRAGEPRAAARRARRHHQPRRLRQQRRGVPALYRRVAGRPGLRTDPSPDGRRRHGRDRPRAVVAMAASRRSRVPRPRTDRLRAVRPGACRPYPSPAPEPAPRRRPRRCRRRPDFPHDPCGRTGRLPHPARVQPTVIFSLLPPGEGARRADEGARRSVLTRSVRTLSPTPLPQGEGLNTTGAMS